jgi:hypothetical protein
MCSACNLPPNLWDYFVETAAYIIQRCPTTYQNKQTPYEAWYEEKPDLSNLREIGCQAFVLIQNKHNPKIFKRGIKCQLISYSHTSKAYICYDKLSRHVLTSYHVEFIESHQTVPTPLHPGQVVNKDTEDTINQRIQVEDDDDDDDDEESLEMPEDHPEPPPLDVEPNAQ